ncbi:alkaline phosphatase [Halegenticoccus tardaugens]|uniref:alkaline phosphatase n=1 Tax=Halegenticoccus tardaugens TaxID=2071624 RepID=UPI0013E986C4|nr:alkaline phosphatase [Halegenticoccus tardaugens]
MRRRDFIGALAALGITGTASTAGMAKEGAGPAATSAGSAFERMGVENVMVLIGDGMGFDHIEVTEEVHGRLAMQDIRHTGLTQTDSRSGEVTDSAAAGTALATGFMAYNGQISVYGDEESEDVTDLTTILEVAEALDMSTGLVSTSRITHATPAVYAAHNYDRGNEEEIADDMIASGADVLLGGGTEKFSDEQLETAEEEGYELLSDASDLADASGEKLLGLFSESHVPYALDRDDSTPGLLDMTEATVSHLEAGDEGFFAMVEAARIDHAAHGNDVAATIGETKEFDDVVEFALDYAAENEDTLVIVTSDHETGGLATGNDYGSPIETEKIADAEASIETMVEAIEDGGDVAEVVEEHAHVELTEEDLAYVEEQRDADDEYAFSNALGEVISDHLGIAWASNFHTGPAQTAMAFGPGAEWLLGWNHHTDLSKKTLALMLFGDDEEELQSAAEDALAQHADANATVSPDEGYEMLLDLVGEPVGDGVPAALDANGDGLVDYGDVLALLTGEMGEEPDECEREGGDETETLSAPA